MHTISKVIEFRANTFGYKQTANMHTKSKRSSNNERTKQDRSHCLRRFIFLQSQRQQIHHKTLAQYQYHHQKRNGAILYVLEIHQNTSHGNQSRIRARSLQFVITAPSRRHQFPPFQWQIHSTSASPWSPPVHHQYPQCRQPLCPSRS